MLSSIRRLLSRVCLDYLFPANKQKEDTTLIDGLGLNGLQGLEIRDVNIMIVPDDEGNNMNGSVVIPNPGHLTIEMVHPPSSIKEKEKKKKKY